MHWRIMWFWLRFRESGWMIFLVQLTSDEARTDAHRFYERLGFVGSHRGFRYTSAPDHSSHPEER